MDFEFSIEENEFSQHFRKFCENEIAPFTAAADEAGQLPRIHYKKLGEIGYTGLLHKRSLGGQEASLIQAILAQTILAEYCGSTFFSVGASCGLFAGPVADYAESGVAQRLVPSVISGETIGCLAVTEPDTGTDVSAIKTRVKASGGKLLLSGQKTYITNAPIADYALVLARYCRTEQTEGSLTCFLVPLDRQGVVQGKPMKKMGLRASPTGELFFDGVEITEADILGKPGQGFRIVMEAFQLERLSLAAYCVGVMRACMEDSRRYSRDRKSFGRPIAKHQSVAFMLADMKTKLEAASLLLWETTWLLDQQWSSEKRTSRVVHNGYPVDLNARAAETKLLASTYAREVANLAVQLHGGAGYMEEFRVCRLYRDVKIAEIGGGTSEIQRQIVAHAELKRIRG
jgi:alkylation response protein AidB-like acyl-CoA dehydrogenase